MRQRRAGIPGQDGRGRIAAACQFARPLDDYEIAPGGNLAPKKWLDANARRFAQISKLGVYGNWMFKGDVGSVMGGRNL